YRSGRESLRSGSDDSGGARHWVVFATPTQLANFGQCDALIDISRYFAALQRHAIRNSRE
ncbi:hypothetical protein, partial [Burkholderia ambifaria]|uniref:hypothetical protein n=1 Tax=Burkholderia ambifaria TaxID=152480 RepID=UPI001E6066EC